MRKKSRFNAEKIGKSAARLVAAGFACLTVMGLVVPTADAVAGRRVCRYDTDSTTDGNVYAMNYKEAGGCPAWRDAQGAPRFPYRDKVTCEQFAADIKLKGEDPCRTRMTKDRVYLVTWSPVSFADRGHI